jgi:hypothetical protein
MIRLIMREDDASMAANVGGGVRTTYKTFRMHLPTIEHYLREQQSYVQRYIVGVELEQGGEESQGEEESRKAESVKNAS